MFNKIINSNGPIKYEFTDFRHIKMKNHAAPISIMEDEATFMKSIIEKYNLKCGYELATGCGISAIAAGMGFETTGGKLLSMDCYVEEIHDDAGLYKDNLVINGISDGLESAKFLRNMFGLEQQIEFVLGVSPKDVPMNSENFLKANSKYFFKKGKFDYVFIDSGHFEDQLILDIEAIKPYTSKKCVWLFHGVYPDLFTDSVHHYIYQTFGKNIEIVLPYPPGDVSTAIMAGENLGMILIGLEK